MNDRSLEPISTLVWWCPTCQIDVHPEAVTYNEYHDARFGGCGRKVTTKVSEQTSSLQGECSSETTSKPDLGRRNGKTGESPAPLPSNSLFERLRYWRMECSDIGVANRLMREAADEIERLQHQLLLMTNERDMLKQQRADWKAVADSRAGVETAAVKKCEWGYDAGDDVWHTGCGEMWTLTCNDLYANGLEFCPCCGFKVEDLTRPAEKSSEQPARTNQGDSDCVMPDDTCEHGVPRKFCTAVHLACEPGCVLTGPHELCEIRAENGNEQ